MLRKMNYKTISGFAQAEYVEKRSRFICSAAPVSNEPDALSFIENIKKQNFGARHNIFAYSLFENNIRRFSDDGEPQGTAGIPALSVLERNEIFDCVLVVTRYFGGILLGAAGLTRAYSHSAKLGIEAAEIVVRKDAYLAELDCDYSCFENIKSLITELEGQVENCDFSDSIHLSFSIPKDVFSYFCGRISEDSAGKTSANIIKEKFL